MLAHVCERLPKLAIKAPVSFVIYASYAPRHLLFPQHYPAAVITNLIFFAYLFVRELPCFVGSWLFLTLNRPTVLNKPQYLINL